MMKATSSELLTGELECWQVLILTPGTELARELCKPAQFPAILFQTMQKNIEPIRIVTATGYSHVDASIVNGCR